MQRNGLSMKNYHLIAGPCSAESREQVLAVASGLKSLNLQYFRAGVWKPRTRPGKFEGIGEPALKWLAEAREMFGLKIITEVAEPSHVEACLRYNIDALWIGARTTVNPFSVQAVADALHGVDIPVMIKNPVSPDIELWFGAFERVARSGISRISAIHRGFTSSGESILRNIPYWRIPIELKTRMPEIPIYCDPSHICGKRKLLYPVAQQALDLLFDGLMFEAHTDPDNALSDSAQQLTPHDLEVLLSRLQSRSPEINTTEEKLEIEALRKEVDSIDEKIVDMLAQRMRCTGKIGILKNDSSASTYQPSRWEEILRSRGELAAEKGLNENFIRRLYQIIHEETIQNQEDVRFSKGEIVICENRK